ncbi:hypothetical protein EMIT0P260_100137 [Pseudomonas sp. IT-P260]
MKIFTQTINSLENDMPTDLILRCSTINNLDIFKHWDGRYSNLARPLQPASRPPLSARNAP